MSCLEDLASWRPQHVSVANVMFGTGRAMLIACALMGTASVFDSIMFSMAVRDASSTEGVCHFKLGGKGGPGTSKAVWVSALSCSGARLSSRYFSNCPGEVSLRI